MTGETKKGGGVVEGFSLTGDEVNGLEDKSFTITDEPFYREMPSIDNPEKVKKKLIIPVELANGTRAEWYANKTSQKTIMAKRGRVLSEWVGYQDTFVIKRQVVGKDEKNVIYLE